MEMVGGEQRRTGLSVQFYVGGVLNPQKSEEAGRPIYDDRDFVRICVAGDSTNIVEHEVDMKNPHPDGDRRFMQQYEAWKKGLDQDAASGTPLSMLPGMTPARIEELKHSHIRTVEQMAEAPDSAGQGLMGFNGLKQKARAFLEVATAEAPLAKLRADAEKKDAEIETLRQAVAEQAAMLKELQATQKRAAK